jgi:hypothetical protein
MIRLDPLMQNILQDSPDEDYENDTDLYEEVLEIDPYGEARLVMRRKKKKKPQHRELN